MRRRQRHALDFFAGIARAPLWLIALFGAVVGGLLGVTVAIAYPHWGPLLAVGAFPWVIGIEIGAPIVALIAVLIALSSETDWFELPPQYRASTPWWRTAMATAAAGLAVLLAGAVITEHVWVPDTAPESGRLHWQTKNTTRFGADDAAATAAMVAQAVFPGPAPPSVLLAPRDDPIAMVAAAPLMRTLEAPLLLLDPGGTVPDATLERLESWAGETSRVVVVGAGMPADLELPRGVAVEALVEPDPQALFDAVNELLREAGLAVRPVVAVGGDALQLLPAAAWLAHEPSPIAWQSGGDYVYAGSEAVPDTAGARRVGANDPVRHALRIARFRDAEADIGWGIDDTEPESWHTAIVADVAAWEQAAAGLALAAWGKPGPLLWLDGGTPRPVESLLWTLGPAFESTPAEGPFNHLWILGTQDHVSFDTQSRLDYVSEMQPVQTRGPGVTWVELVVLIWLALSFVAACWVLADALNRLPVPGVVKAAWFTSTLLLGPIGVLIYVLAYRRRAAQVRNGMVMWQRPMWLQAAVATTRSVSAGTFFMVIVSALVFLAGAPLWPNDTRWLFVVGNSMVLTMIVVSYLAALLVSTLLLMTPMMRHHHMMQTGTRPGYWKAFLPALRNMAINMTVLTAFMFASMWIWMHEFFQMMASQEQIFWWYALLMGVAAGVISIYPINWWLVATNRKGGDT